MLSDKRSSWISTKNAREDAEFPMRNDEERAADAVKSSSATQVDDVASHESERFRSACEADKRQLFDEHRKEVSLSLRRWERHQLREKTRARASRLATMKDENHERISNLQGGAKAYNLKSIRQAAIQGDISRLVELLSLGFDADASSAMGLTPLLGACQSGCLEAVKVLLRSGANVNLQHVKSKRTALMEASSREDPAVVRELLRYGARLTIQDANGETAFDCAKDLTIHHYLALAASIWSYESANVFPTPFRSACETFFLIRKRQTALSSERQVATKREIASLLPIFVRSAAEAKMRYDESMRLSHAQVTLLAKIDVLNRAAAQFDDDRVHLLESIQQALLSQAEANQSRSLSCQSITQILSYCSRHWFDARDEQRHHHRRKHHKRHPPITPTKPRTALSLLPSPLETEWNDVERALLEQCDQLRRSQSEEKSDSASGVARHKSTGETLARLTVCIEEARHLPFRDPRLREPVDPLVRATVRDRAAGDRETACTDIRLGDRNPSWNAQFTFSVESTQADLLIQVIDAKRQEIAGEVAVSLRTLLDQKDHDAWHTLPPTLRQQALEAPREQPAQVRMTLRLVHTPSMLLTREIQQLLAKRNDTLRRKHAFMQSALDGCLKRLGA